MMGDDFATSLKKTTSMFEEYVRPVAPYMMRGHLIPIEGKADAELATMLDMHAGVDLFCLDRDLIYGVASRIQVTQRPFNTFTVRKSRDSGAITEYEKRRASIGTGYMYPRITDQAYVSAPTGGRLLSMAVCLTEELIRYCTDGHAFTRHTGAGQRGGAEFYVCNWYDMATRGCALRVMDASGYVCQYNMPGLGC